VVEAGSKEVLEAGEVESVKVVAQDGCGGVSSARGDD